MKQFLIFTIFTFNLYAQVENGVVTVPEVNANQSTKVQSNVFVDKEGDTVTVLDTNVRSKIADAKKIKATNLYDNEQEINAYKKQYEQNILEVKQSELGEYLVVEGDTLKGISQKIYGSSKRWKEIFILNEDALKDDKVKIGSKLKYRLPIKENSDERKELPNETK